MDENEIALEAVVGKVEAGEPLAASELEALERAVARRPGNLDWMLCLAHALVNADRPAAALPILDAAARLKPGEVLVEIARSRAFAALERWPEAEAGLRAVLQRLPGHADALRALSLLRLKSGAPAEAAELARRVLETDPLDDAARYILAEAEAAAGGEAPAGQPNAAEGCGTLEEFASELARALGERGLKHRVAPRASAAVVHLAPGRTVRLSLGALFSACRAEPRGKAWFVEDLVGRLSRLSAPERVPALSEVRERILPVLRPPSFLTRTGPVAQCEASGGLLWLFAIDHPDFVSYLPPEAPGNWGLDADELTALAFENLGRAPLAPTRYRLGRKGFEPLDPDSPRWDLLAFEAGDGYDASRLLSPRHQELLARAGAGPWIVAIPSTHHALLARAGDGQADAVLAALARSEAQEEDGLCAELFGLEAGRLSPRRPAAG